VTSASRARYVFSGVPPCLWKDLPDTVATGAGRLEERVVPGGGVHAPGRLGRSFATALTGLQEGARRIADFIESKFSTYQRW